MGSILLYREKVATLRTSVCATCAECVCVCVKHTQDLLPKLLHTLAFGKRVVLQILIGGEEDKNLFQKRRDVDYESYDYVSFAILFIIDLLFT